jgi:hypothetical protein
MYLGILTTCCGARGWNRTRSLVSYVNIAKGVWFAGTEKMF